MSKGVVSKSPNLPWKVKLYLNTMGMGAVFASRSDGTVKRGVVNLFDLKNSAKNEPINGVTSFDTIIDKSRNLWYRVYVPINGDASVPLPILFYFHGGGFVFMQANSRPYDEFCNRLARELKVIVVSTNYRLAPEHQYPAQYEDGFEAVKYIDNSGFKGFPSVNPKRCFFAGDSAGANLAHHVILKACEYDRFQQLKVVGLVSLQPFFGGEERVESEIRLEGAPVLNLDLTDWCWKSFLPDGFNRDHQVVNVFGSQYAVDLSVLNFPPTIIFVGGYDPLLDRGKLYYEGLKKAGKEAYLVDYPNAIHTFYGSEGTPESGLMINEVREFMKKQM